MRCKACNTILSDVELTRKDRDTGEHLDLCTPCYIHSEEAKFLAPEGRVPAEDVDDDA